MKVRALYQLGANILMWLCVPIVIGGIALARNTPLEQPFPTAELLKLIEPSQLFLFLGAGALYFCVFAFIRHKSMVTEEQNRATLFAELGFDEMASALYSFGSIMLVSVFVGASAWYLLATLACYFVGYYLKPSSTIRVPDSLCS